MNAVAGDPDVEVRLASHRYRYIHDWACLPRGWSFGDESGGRPPRTAVKGAYAGEGEIAVISRGGRPVTVFGLDGRFVTAWGEGRFTPWLHGLAITRDGSVWIVDAGSHTAVKHDRDGRVLQTLGDPFGPSRTIDARPFNMPTGLAEAPDGSLYVSDGYGNRRVHRFAPDGTHLHGWGGPGQGAGLFAEVHYVAVAPDSRVFVTDRDNAVVQVFTADGEYLASWTEFDRPSDIAIVGDLAYVTARDGVSVLGLDGRRIDHLAADAIGGVALRGHGIWLDPAGSIYLAQAGKVVSKLERF